MIEPVIIVHGGAGDIPPRRVPLKLEGIQEATLIGHRLLQRGKSALDAVEEAVKCLELNENFNAGYGAVLNYDGNVEVEASIMHGRDLEAGCVTLLKDIQHPISVARKVMEKSNHTFLGGDNAMIFAQEHGFEILPEGSLITEDARKTLADYKARQASLDPLEARTELMTSDLSTVGAVALDQMGDIAVATSTGGMTGKIPGRIGDTPILGCGTYVDNNIGGVSTTGHGETIMRFNLASSIVQKMKYQPQMDPQKATQSVVKEMTRRLKGTGGAITVDKNGKTGVYFTSKQMAWGTVREQRFYFGISDGICISRSI